MTNKEKALLTSNTLNKYNAGDCLTDEELIILKDAMEFLEHFFRSQKISPLAMAYGMDAESLTRIIEARADNKNRKTLTAG